LNKKQIAEIKKRLLEERKSLLKQYHDLEEGNLSSSQSDLTGEVGFDEEYADSGTFTFERERDLSLSNNVKDLLKKVEMALQKIEQGTYGICDMCKKDIPEERLKALPYANLCIACKQKEEKESR
jgi:RNA polymerase-binding protein DksA